MCYTYDVGVDMGGRLYFQHSYVKGDGYLYDKTSINLPEVILSMLAISYVPQLIPAIPAYIKAFAR